LSRTGQIGELRSAVRFPLRLPVEVKTQQDGHQAETADISSGGVLFYLEAELPVGSIIEFNLTMPADVLGTPTAIQVHCVGRVMRSFVEDGRRAIAAVIDEYSFERS
jgi:PilZ domain